MVEVVAIDTSQLSTLKRSYLFSCLSEELFVSAMADARVVSFDLGSIISEEQSSKSLFVLLSGKVRLLLQDPNSQSEDSILSLSRPGDIFGSLSFQAEGEPFFTATGASKGGSALELPARAVTGLCESSELFSERLERSLRAIAVYASLKTFPAFGSLTYWQLRPLLLKSYVLEETATSTLRAAIPDLSAMVVCLHGGLQRTENNQQYELPKGRAFVPEQALREGEWSIPAGARLWVVPSPVIADLHLTQPELWTEVNELLQGEAATVSMKPLQVAAKPAAKPPEPLEETRVTRLRRAFHRYPHIRQQTQMDCGATCLGMICQFYGKTVPLNRLRVLCNVSSYGTSLLAIAESAEKLGFTTRGVRASFDGMRKLKTPFICHWKGNHFIIVYDMTDKGATVGDPGDDILHLSKEEFLAGASGVGLEVIPTEEFGKVKPGTSPLLAYMPVVKPYLPLFFHVFVASVAYQILMLISPLFTQQVIDKVIVHQSLSMLNIMIVGMVIVTTFSTLISMLRGFVLSYLAMSLDQALFVAFFRHMVSLPIDFFHQRTTGEIISRFGENKKITSFISGVGVSILLDAFTFVIYLGMIFSYNQTYAAAALAYVLIMIVMILLTRPILRRLAQRSFEKDMASSSFMIESVRGLERIKSSATENRTRWKWESLFYDSMNVRFQSMLVSSGITLVSQTLNFAGTTFLLWLGANLVINHTLSIGQLMALSSMVGMMSTPLLKLVEVWNSLQDVNISLERLGDVFEAQPEEVDADKKVPLHNMNGQVAFENVTFRYTDLGDKNTLVNVSFTVNPGETVAIVGRSGSGKSTIIRLVQGLYHPKEGRVLIDGYDLRNVSLRDLRRQTGVVAQQDYMFRGTIRESLSLYKPDASLEEVIAAAKMSGIHDFITTLPYGYDTPISEGATNISGGQRQRISIATALLHNPKILIFDEATSALDTESERKIQESLERVREGRTLFIIAHRLSTVATADRILVMDRGQIIEQGTHQSLLAEKGLYYHLYNQQSFA
jgi:ATP-binding cassette, subfamily B, bacterial HlyB/CyaB